jgi:hypothetical protein
MKLKSVITSLFLFLNCVLISQVSYFQMQGFTDSVSTPGLKKYGLKMRFPGATGQLFYTVTDTVTNSIYFGDSIPNIFTNLTGSHPIACIAQRMANMNDTIGLSIIDPSKPSMISIGQLISSTGTNCDGEIHGFVDTLGRNFFGQGLYTQTGFIDEASQLIYAAPMGQNDWTALCAGRYALSVISSPIGNSTTAKYEEFIDFYIGAQAYSFANVTINVNPYALSNGAVCLGKVRVSTSLTPPPFYSFDNGPYTTIDSLTNLCAGYHKVNIATTQDTIGRFFIINDSSNVITNSNNSGIVIDTIIYNYVNCNFNYSLPIDSAFLISAQPIDSNTIFLSWQIWQSGILTSVSDTISYTFQSGNNMISLVIFCGNARTTLSVGHNSFRINDYTVLINPVVMNVKSLSNDRVIIYPNPVTDLININLSGALIELSDLIGNQILKTIITESTQLNVSFLPQGVYFLKITKNNNSHVKKVIKQ